jgi:glyoxylase-like metal-dependent hydrolase (beta-lactamase superfamily II)
VISTDDIVRLHLGHFTRPADGSMPGEPQFVCAYLIRHPDGLVLFDTGIGEGDQEMDATYHPVRRRLGDALASVGVEASDVRAVINCHLHPDHCGGNPSFGGTPIFVQAREHEAAHGADYTIPGLVDFAGAAYELHDGEADVAPGLRIVPTPGHTPGHQSLVVTTRQGNIVIAGQAMTFASDYARAHLAWHLARDGGDDPSHAYPWWIDRLQAFDPARVLFAHDTAVWDADAVRSLGP